MKNYILLALVALLVTSCAPQLTRGTQYPAMYEEKPVTIVVMPPINNTSHAEAKDYFYTTMHSPICERGYYVFSPMLTMEMFQNESAYDAEQFIEGDLTMFHNVLGADAAIFTTIKSWKKSNIGGKITVGVEYLVRSTKTNETLYKREGLMTVDTSVQSTGGGGLGALAALAATAIKTAATDRVVAGRACTRYILTDLPSGKYAPDYDQDQQSPAGQPYVRATVKQ